MDSEKKDIVGDGRDGEDYIHVEAGYSRTVNQCSASFELKSLFCALYELKTLLDDPRKV